MQASLFRKSAVLIEKNSLHCMLYEDVLEANGFDVYVAKSAMDGLIKIRETRRDLAVINTEIAEESFVEKLIAKMKTERAFVSMPIIGLSVYKPECKKNIAETLDAFLTKPISMDKLTESIFTCIESKINGSANSGDY
jgi:DNA-binding response OmpR family regulator